MKKNNPLMLPILVIGIIIIIFFLGSHFLSQYIQREIDRQQIGSFSIQSKIIKVNLFLKQVKINDIIATDSKQNQEIRISQIQASGIRILPYIFNNNILINHLTIENPEINLIKNQSIDTTNNEKMDDNFKLLIINKMEILNAALVLQNDTSNETDTLLSLRSWLTIQNLNINSNNEQFTFQDHSAEQIQIEAYEVNYKLPGELYQIHIDSIFFNSENEIMTISNAHFSSLHSKYDLSKQTGYEIDWFDISLEMLKIEEINFNAILRDTSVIFRKAFMENLDASIFRDKRPPFPDKPESKLPIEMLKNIPVKFHSDTIFLKDSDITYEEHSENSIEPGAVRFAQVYATIFNLSTLNDSIKGQTAISAQALVMNESLLTVNFIFPNNKYSYQNRVYGSLNPLNIESFNPILIPSAFVKVKEGNLKSMQFDFTYDDIKSEGSLAMEYENLDIVLLDKEDGSPQKIKTFITETFILKKENLKDNKSYQQGSISFERHRQKSIFNYWWKSLFSGIQDILAF